MALTKQIDPEWPMCFHDNRNTGRTNVKGEILNPSIKWKYYIGGNAKIVSLKGLFSEDDKYLLIMYGGKVFLWSAKKEIVWESSLINATELIAVQDLNEDEIKEIVVSAANRIYILSSLNGEILWSYTFPNTSSPGRFVTKVGSLGSHGICLITWPVGMGSPGHGYAFNFKNGFKNAEIVWSAYAPETEAFTPVLIVTDVDLDGKNEVVISTYNKVYVFSGEDGREKAVSQNLETNPSYKNGRNYGCLISADYDGDSYPEIFILAHVLNQHIGVIENGPEGVSKYYSWDKFFQYSYPHDEKEIHIVPESVQDVDGDNKMEITASLFNEIGDEKWHLVVIDPSDGHYKYDEVDLYLCGIADLDNDGRLEIVASRQTKREIVDFSSLIICKIMNGKINHIYEIEKCKVILQSRVEYDLSISDMGECPSVFLTDMDKDEFKELFVYFDHDEDGKPESIAAFGGKVLVKKWEAKIPEMFNENFTVIDVDDFDGDGEIEILTKGSDGYIRVLRNNFSEKNAIKSGGFACCPLVARLNEAGDIRVVVSTSSGEIKVLKVEREIEPRVLWVHSGYGRFSPHQGMGGLSPVIVDLDRDCEKEILIADSSYKKVSKIIVLSADGKEKMIYHLSGQPFDWNVGYFSEKDGLGFYVATLRPRCPNIADTFMFKCKGNAEPLWVRLNVAPYWGLAAIYDVDGDGLDDVIMLEHFNFYIIDGLTGEDLAPVSMLRCGNAATGMHTPIIDDFDGDGEMEILLVAGWGTIRLFKINRKEKSDLSIIEKWVHEFTANMKIYGRVVTHEISAIMSAVADVDGDGCLEIGVGTRSGKLICYDAATGKIKWMYELKCIPSHIVAADIDGCGKYEFIFGANDGKLYVLKGDENLVERVLWSYDFGYEVKYVSIADIDGDEKAEILVSVSDGYIYAIDEKDD